MVVRQPFVVVQRPVPVDVDGIRSTVSGVRASARTDGPTEVAGLPRLTASIVREASRARAEAEPHQAGPAVPALEIVAAGVPLQAHEARTGTVVARVRDDSGEIKPLEFNETWQRNDATDVNFTSDYPIGDNVELMNVRVRNLKCTCAAAADSAASEAPATATAPTN